MRSRVSAVAASSRHTEQQEELFQLGGRLSRGSALDYIYELLGSSPIHSTDSACHSE
jgi:hypothetical protein